MTIKEVVCAKTIKEEEVFAESMDFDNNIYAFSKDRNIYLITEDDDNCCKSIVSLVGTFFEWEDIDDIVEHNRVYEFSGDNAQKEFLEWALNQI